MSVQTTRYLDSAILRQNVIAGIEDISEALGEVTVVARRDGLLELLRRLRDDERFRFNYLSDLSGVDLGEFASPRFAVAYHLYSLQYNHRLRVKVFLDEDDATLPSATVLWSAANWQEREVFDMFGITFEGHPDLRRILMPADYEGYPLRKDFPIKGY
jgi:NADH-quinone oxidoreductase subunit C